MYKALISFSGKLSMRKGEVKAITDKELIADLTQAGYIEEVKPAKKETKAEVKEAKAEVPKPKKTPPKKTAKKK